MHVRNLLLAHAVAGGAALANSPMALLPGGSQSVAGINELATGGCDIGTVPCGSGCMPIGSSCCSGLGYCDIGDRCTADNDCCPVGHQYLVSAHQSPHFPLLFGLLSLNPLCPFLDWQDLQRPGHLQNRLRGVRIGVSKHP